MASESINRSAPLIGDNARFAIPQKEQDNIRIVSFNICGIKNVLNYMPWCLNKTFEDMFDILQGDIICFQETRIQAEDVTRSIAMVDNFNCFFSFPINKKGYSGVALYVHKKIGVRKAEEGITGWLDSGYRSKPYREIDQPQSIGGYPQNIDQKLGLDIDSEGRCIVLDVGFAVVIGLYCPANSSGNRDDYRRRFFECLEARVRNLTETCGRQVIVLGDLNVTADLIDSAEAQQQMYQQKKLRYFGDDEKFIVENASIRREFVGLNQERKMINRWKNGIEPQLVDWCREKHPYRLRMYTCWNVKKGARAGNFGSRIDYIFSTPGFNCSNADILPNLLGSDHCPVFADLGSIHICSWISQKAKPPLPKLCAANMPKFKMNDIFRHFSGKNIAKEQDGSYELKEDFRKDCSHLDKVIQRPAKVQRSTKQTGKQTSIFNFVDSPKQRADECYKDDSSSSKTYCDSRNNNSNKAVSMGHVQQFPEWKKIFRTPTPPLCTFHSQPCKLMTTRKKGINQGRSFWVCSL